MNGGLWRKVAPLGLALAVGCADRPEGVARSNTGSFEWPLTGRLTDPALAGGEALALATDGTVARAPVAADGRFSLALPGGRTWIVHFAKDAAFGATLWVTGHAGGLTSRLRLPERLAKQEDVSTLRSALEEDGTPGAGGSGGTGAGAPDDGSDDLAGDEASGEGDLDLGEVATDGGIATPENDPGAVLDGDGDGVADADDEDADGSGVPDGLEEEEDDLDGAAAGLLVTKIEPRPGEEGVDRGEKVEVKFTVPVDPATVTPATVRLLDQAGAAVAVELALDRDGRELTLEPVEELVAGAAYAVELAGVAAVSGEPLGSPFRSTFRVEADDDEGEERETAETLRVRDLDPRHGEDDVDLDVEIEVEFNLPLDEATVAIGEAGLRLLGPDGAGVPGTLTLERAKRLIFVPAAPLAPASDYVLAIGAGFEAQGPQAMAAAVRFSFRTGEAGEEDEAGGRGNGRAKEPDDKAKGDKAKEPDDDAEDGDEDAGASGDVPADPAGS